MPKANIIERLKYQSKDNHSYRALAALSSCNHALMHARNETALLNQICEIIVKIGQYKLAYVAQPLKDKQKNVKIIASAGAPKKYARQVKISWAKDNILGQGPVGTSLRTRAIELGNNFSMDTNLHPWKKYALTLGFQSIISLPLISRRKHYGSLAIYAEKPNAFDKEEISLLKELADDLAFGIYTLRISQAHKRAQLKLKHSNELLEKVFSNTNFMLAYLDPRFNFIRVNSAYAKANNLRPELLIKRNFFQIFPHISSKKTFQNVLKTGNPYQAFAEPIIQWQNNVKQIAYWDWSIQAIKEPGNKITGILLSIVDVTSRVLTEEKLIESYKHLGVINRQISILLDLNKRSDEGNLSEIIDYIIASTLNLSQAKIVSFYRYKETKNCLRLVSSSNNNFKIEKLILVENYPFLTPVVKDNQRIQGIFQENVSCRISQDDELKYFLFLPLTIQKKTKGVLFLGFDKKDSLTTQELEFYEAFINQASYVLQNLDIA